jgi:cytochrome c peroxidase
VSETIKPADLPLSKQAAYAKYLGPTADQALNRFPNDVEQNIREKNVCNAVKTASYKALYAQAFGEAINCNPTPQGSPAYRTSYKRIAVALAAWQASKDVNSFSSKRDKALKKDAKFPLENFSDQENLGHDLFYGIKSELNPSGKNAFCIACHNGVPEGDAADPTGEAPHQLYADNRYHNIDVPFNREIPGVAKGDKIGLKAHIPSVPKGNFKTPTLRNVAKGLGGGFVKAYTHNGYFKSPKGIVHFYNTRDSLGPSCDDRGIPNATEKEALANDCWPKPEFENPAVFVIGNLGLSDSEEDAIVAYLKTLSDDYTPKAP